MVAQDTDEGAPTTETHTQNRKRAQIEEDSAELENFPEIQNLFAGFVDALNVKDTETISDRVKRGTRRKMLSQSSEDISNAPSRSLKRVKRESRKAKSGKKVKEDSKKTSKKVAELEPIEEDVKKENLVNGEESAERRKSEPKDEQEEQRKEAPPNPEQPETTQLGAVKLDSNNQNLESNFNGRKQNWERAKKRGEKRGKGGKGGKRGKEGERREK